MPGREFWWKFGGPFGFGFAWGIPPFWGRFDPFPSIKEEIQMLEEYKKHLEEYQRELDEELARVEERIRRLRGQGKE